MDRETEEEKRQLKNVLQLRLLQNLDGLAMFCYKQAVDTCIRVLKEGGMDSVKFEGGTPSRITAAKAIIEAAIVVMGHVGLTPPPRPQGRNTNSAVKVVGTAMA